MEESELENARVSETEDVEEKPLEETSTNVEDSRLPPAPDVTYDATLLENQSETSSGSAGGRERGEENGQEEGEKEEARSAAKEKAVRFEGVDEKRTEGGEGEEEEGRERQKDGRTEEDEWMDILGSGDLKKKV